MNKPKKAAILSVTPIRMDPDADEIAERYATMLGASKPKFVSNVMRALKDMVEGPGTSTLVKMLRSGHPSQPEMVFDKDEEDDPRKMSPELERMISETVSNTLTRILEEKGSPMLNEDAPPYSTKRKKKTG